MVQSANVRFSWYSENAARRSRLHRGFIVNLFRVLFSALTGAFLSLIAVPAFAEDDTSVSIRFEKKIQLPTAETVGGPIALTRIAWGGISNQIATAAFSGRNIYLIDVKAESVNKFDSGLNGIIEPTLLWSHRKSLLIASRAASVRVFETSEAIPKPTLAIDNNLPRPLLARGVALIEKSAEEWLILSGETNKKIDPTNPEVVAHLLSTGKRMFEWKFPDDGANYRISQSSAALAEGHVVLAAWVQRVVSPKTSGARPISTQEIWIINPERERDSCKIPPTQGISEGASITLEQPSISPDGRWLATADGANEYVHIYKTKSCEEAAKLPLRGGPNPRFLTFSPNGRWLLGTSPMALGKREGRIYVWRTADWKLIYQGTQTFPYQAAFDKASSHFAIATVDGVYIYRISER